MSRRSPKAQELVDLMREAAEELAASQGWINPSSVYLFCPQYVVAEMLDVDVSTIRRWFYRYPDLKLEVNMSRHSAVMEDGQRRLRDGCVWAVAIKPQKSPLRFYREVLEQEYRDFAADIDAGRTLHGPIPTKTESPVDTLLAWSLADHEPPVEDLVGPCRAIDAVRQAVDNPRTIAQAANSIVKILGDQGWERMWMRQLWRVVRGAISVDGLAGTIERVLVDRREGFARSAPALAIARLEGSPTGGATW